MACYNLLQFPPNGSSGLIGINVTHIHVRCGGLFVFGYSCTAVVNQLYPNMKRPPMQACGLGQHRRRKDMACYSPPSMAALACMLMIHTYICMVWWTVLCLGATAVNQA